jgi:ribonuclease HI
VPPPHPGAAEAATSAEIPTKSSAALRAPLVVRVRLIASSYPTSVDSCEGARVPWVRALLRGQKVFARADAKGALVAEGGRVEVRYKANDGRRYGARADNLEVVPGEILPDDACGPAEAVAPRERDDKAGGAAKSATKGARAKTPAAAPKVPADAVIVYADGACSGNPGPAGAGIVVIEPEQRVEISEYLGTGTNNIAELTAVLRALEELDPARPAVIHTDSQYTIGVVQKGWKAKANVELVARVREALAGRKATRLVYVPGHAGVILNERADTLAREAVSGRRSRRDVYASKKPEPPAS